jgi:hypothetical protein
MEIDKHCKNTMSILGKPYREIHMAIDQFYPNYRGSMHWIVLHHQLGIELLVERYGEEARRPAEIHIEDDMGFVPDAPDDPRLLNQVDLRVEFLAQLRKDLRAVFNRDFSI